MDFCWDQRIVVYFFYSRMKYLCSQWNRNDSCLKYSVIGPRFTLIGNKRYYEKVSYFDDVFCEYWSLATHVMYHTEQLVTRNKYKMLNFCYENWYAKMCFTQYCCQTLRGTIECISVSSLVTALLFSNYRFSVLKCLRNSAEYKIATKSLLHLNPSMKYMQLHCLESDVKSVTA